MTLPPRLPLVLLVLAALLLGACGGDEGDEPAADGSEAVAEDGGGHGSDPGPEHIHGLGVNPADGALYIATHYGLYRSPEGSQDAERVGEGMQDLMGFTVAGPDDFLASGHPGPGEAGPPHLGLVSSADGGLTWEEVSLGGEADFHALVFAHERIYGYDATGGRLMVSDDRGHSWEVRDAPAPVIDLAVDPTDPRRVVASTEGGLAVSENEGRRWRPIDGDPRVGLLAWPAESRLYLVDAEGRVEVSADRGRRWDHLADLGGHPAALVAESGRELYAALAEGIVLASTDGGASWTLRTAP